MSEAKTKKVVRPAEKAKASGKKKRGVSIKIVILIPVFVLGLISIGASVFSFMGIRSVNTTATKIAEENMASIAELGKIQESSKNIHLKALSHIIASSSDMMIEVVEQVRSGEESLDGLVDAYAVYVTEDTQSTYNELKSNYQNLKDQISQLLAYSGNSQNTEAYALANNEVANYANAMSSNIDGMVEMANSSAEMMREELKSVYNRAVLITVVIVVVSILALLIALYSVLRRVIHPLSSAKKEITGIIKDIDNRQGDLTRRIPIHADDEIAALCNGINVFMGKLQEIFQVITGNATKMDVVVNDVMNSITTSNESASDLSALTEELTATMEGMSANASHINDNAINVEKEVNAIAGRTVEINRYTKRMKTHADKMENKARLNMQSTSEKLDEILLVLNRAIQESSSVDQINTLTDAILNIADQTTLLAINASIEAARAGDKGFGVVASEISHLATESQETANRIQEINLGVMEAVHNLAEQANGLVAYINDSIVPEFAGFVKSGSEYKNNASYIEGAMEEFSVKTDKLQKSMQEIAKSIKTIANAVEEGFNGVSSVADSTQGLVYDLENISKLMNDNQTIAGELKSESDLFVKL